MRQRRREVDYSAIVLPDGTVILASPTRKPAGVRPADDGIARKFAVSQLGRWRWPRSSAAVLQPRRHECLPSRHRQHESQTRSPK